MNLKNANKKIWKITAAFFGAMVVFTLLSRAVYQQGIAVVQTAVAKPGTISHTVRLTGKTEQNQDLAVTTYPGLRVASVQVHEGQQVEQGQLLFTLDLPYLEQAILEQKQQMQKQKLTVQDAWSQNSAAQSQRANQQAQAQESYNLAVNQAQTRLERAERDLDRAMQALEDFLNGTVNNQNREQELMAAVEQAKAQQTAAQSSLEQLQAQMEEQLRQAQEQAQQIPPEGEPGISPEQLEATLQQIRDSFAPQIQQAQQSLQQAQTALSDAENQLNAFRQEQQSSTPQTEAEIRAMVERAEEEYEDALAALDSAKITGGRAIQSASLPTGSNHAPQIGQITYDQMELQLQQMEQLLEAEGKICAPVPGIVTRTQVQTGEKTTDTTALLLADLSKGCRFTGTVSREQSQYIGVGDKVTLKAVGSNKQYTDLSVTTFSPAEDGTSRITVQLPENTLTLGASAELRSTRKSQGYGCCVPLSALHLDERNQPYILVAELTDTVLGQQMQARKVSVTVLEKNETTAALAEGAVGQQDKIIVSSDKPVDAGSRIRVA